MRRYFVVSLALALFTACSTHSPSTSSQAGRHQDITNHEAYGRRFMVASQGNLTSRAARDIFSQGGNLVDAAVAASFAISVERPQSTGIGGGGFLLLHWAEGGKTYAIDFREMAPQAAHETMFQNQDGSVMKYKSIHGPHAVAVPGLVAGLLEIHRRFGSLSREKILQPAIEIAERGFVIYPHLAQAIEEEAKTLKKYPASKKLLFRENGQPLKVGELLRQPELAKTLREISLKGAAGFYSGWVAKAMVDEHKRTGGLLTFNDLANYQVKWRAPVTGTYQDFKLVTMPPPSSGGVHVLEILNILEYDHLRFLGVHSSKAIHLTASAMQQAFADRAKYLGDPDFVAVPVQDITSKAYARRIRDRVFAKTAHPSSEVRPGELSLKESTETSHLSLMDHQGNAIATTQTINGKFGSGIVVPGAGFFFNNEMDDFSAKPGAANMYGVVGGAKNSIQPKKRPLSSMSPTLAFKKGKPVLALGTPNGSRIITCVVQTFLNFAEYGMPLYQSVSALRYHHQWYPDEILVESPSFSPSVSRELKAMGYKVNMEDYGCRVQAVAREGEVLHGVSDPRGEGLALGDVRD